MTPKQRAFIAEYLKDFNATQAAIRAGYSPKTARQIGQQNLSKLYIANEIETALEERTLDAEEALAKVSDIINADIGDYLNIDDYDGRIVSLDLGKAKREGKLHLIKSYQSPSKTSGPKIELYSQLDALKTLLSVYGRIGTKVEIEINVTDQRERILADLAEKSGGYVTESTSRLGGESNGRGIPTG